jgi:hypothetical protein
MSADDVEVMRLFLHEMGMVSFETRALFAALMGDIRRRRFADLADSPSAQSQRVAAGIAAEGIVDLGRLVEPAKIADMRAHLDGCPVYQGHTADQSDLVARDLEALRPTAHYACYGRDDLLRCPHLLEIANDPHLLQIAELYLGCPPTIYDINAWWSLPQGGTPATMAQSLHRDLDDFRFVTLFIFLTPVGPTSGAHRYIRYSHDKTVMAQALGTLGYREPLLGKLVDPLFHWNPYQAAQDAEGVLRQIELLWTGPAGSAVLADTYGLHMGIPPTDGARLMAWVRYGLGASKFVFDAGQHAAVVRQRIPPTDRARYVNRLMLME